MSRRPAGLTAFVCILVFGMGGVRADDLPEGDVIVPVDRARRVVAVIELGDFDGNRQLADKLATELNNSQDLKPLDSSIAINALRDRYEDEDAEPIAKAESEKRSAEENVINYKFSEARQSADNGLVHLHRAMPSPKVLALSADLAFLWGAALLGERKDKEATAAFRLARTLDGNFKPDAGRYLREIVQAFETATKTPPVGRGWIEIGPVAGTVFLDGRDRGSSPQTLPDMTPGLHVVWLAGPDRDTHAVRVNVVAGEKEKATFIDAPINLQKRVKRARLLLRSAPDPAARSAAMQNLVRVLGTTTNGGVKDALLLSESNGKTIVQNWREQGLGFSALREVKPDEKPADLLTPFLPPRKPPPPKKEEPPKPPKVVDTRSWYQKPRYQIGGGVVGAVLIGVAIYALSSWDRTIGFDTNPGFEGNTGNTGRR